MRKIKKTLTENYKNFAFIFDSDLGVYLATDYPVDDETIMFVNVNDNNKLDTLNDVIDYVDNYYAELDDDHTIQEDLTSNNSYDDNYEDIFTIEIISNNDVSEFLEFTNLEDAQDYMDRLKIDDNKSFKYAILKNSENLVYDSWEFNSNAPKKDDEVVQMEDTKLEITNEDLADDIVTDDEKSNNSLLDILKASNSFANNMKTLHWVSAGEDFDTVHKVASDYYDQASEDLDLLAELCLEHNVVIDNPTNLKSNIVKTFEIEDNDMLYLNAVDIFELITTYGEQYISALNIIYTLDVDSSVISELDTLVRYWEKEIRYKNNRRTLFKNK